MKQLYARVENPSAGNEFDRAKVEELDPSKYYEVESVKMGGYHTTIILKDCDTFFNSVNFEFFLDKDGEKIPHNIFSDPDYNPYLKSSVDPYHLLNNH